MSPIVSSAPITPLQAALGPPVLAILVLLATLVPRPCQAEAPDRLADLVVDSYPARSRIELHRLLAAGIANPQAFAWKKYGAHGSEILEALQPLGSAYDQLLVDPAVVARLPEFAAAARLRPARNKDPWREREQFARDGGPATVFRGMYLTEPEIAAARAWGLPCNVFREPPGERVSTFDRAFRASLSEMIGDRLDGTRRSLLLSVTRYFDVAAAVGAIFDRGQKAGGRTVVFKLKVPVRDLIELHHPTPDARLGDALPLFEYPTDWILTASVMQAEVIQPGGATTRYDVDGRLESFVHLKIDPGEIEEVIEVSSPPPRFDWVRR